MAKILPSDLYLSSIKQTQNNSGSNLGKDEFLKILMAQLANQDPLNPMQDREFISQMATFTSLEQMVNMNEGITKLHTGQLLANNLQYSELIGKEITWSESKENEDGSTETIEFKKIVEAVKFNGTDVQVEVEGGQVVDLNLINKISQEKGQDE